MGSSDREEETCTQSYQKNQQAPERYAPYHVQRPRCGACCSAGGKEPAACGSGCREGPLCLVNPVLDQFEGTQLDQEGCLSLPGVVGDVRRAAKVRVEALDENGKPVRFIAEGLLARCLQHEVDHLDGILFIDRAN